MLKILGGTPLAHRRRLSDLARSAERMVIIVPEQYTLQTERDLIHDLDVSGFFDLEVLSPSRLTERVFSLAGMDNRVRIDARGKQLALARVLMQCKKSSSFLKALWIDRALLSVPAA